MFIKASDQTLIPDLIGIYEDTFVLFDAKYYCIQLEERKALRGQPGVGDVTKQYLYQLAYKNFILDHGMTAVKNCFLMPTEKDEVVELGYARIEMLEALGLENIAIRLMPAKDMFHCYLESKKKTFKDALL